MTPHPSRRFEASSGPYFDFSIRGDLSADPVGNPDYELGPKQVVSHRHFVVAEPWEATPPSAGVEGRRHSQRSVGGSVSGCVSPMPVESRLGNLPSRERN